MTTTTYLDGGYAPVHDELTVTDLPVTGTIPPELTGRLARIGPNPMTPPDPAGYHWFLGDGMVHDFGPGRRSLEPVFVPRHDDAAEDDGWVMSYVYDAATDRSDVVIFAAQDISASPVATIHLPRRVPFGFHGNWLADP